MIPAPELQALADAIGLCEAEAGRWQSHDVRTSTHWREVAAQLSEIRLTLSLHDAVRVTKPLRDKALEAERIPTGFMEMRLDAALPAVRPVPAPQEEKQDGSADTKRSMAEREGVSSVASDEREESREGLARVAVEVATTARQPEIDVIHDRFTVSMVNWLRGMGYDDAANSLAEMHVEDRALRKLPGLVFYIPPPPAVSRPPERPEMEKFAEEIAAFVANEVRMNRITRYQEDTLKLWAQRAAALAGVSPAQESRKIDS